VNRVDCHQFKRLSESEWESLGNPHTHAFPFMVRDQCQTIAGITTGSVEGPSEPEKAVVQLMNSRLGGHNLRIYLSDGQNPAEMDNNCTTKDKFVLSTMVCTDGNVRATLSTHLHG
jgi:hypothetical protein